MRSVSAPCICSALLALACGSPNDDRDTQSTAATVTAASGISASAPVTVGETPGDATGPGASTGDASGPGLTGSGSTGEIKFDLAADTGNVDPDTGPAVGGCEKIDFLFVVDNSGSMEDEQVALANSFDGFITSIQNTVMAEDYHLMVIDTDAGSAFLQECFVVCGFFPNCQGYPCDMLPVPEGCDASLGSGLINDPQNMACGVAGDIRYMVDGQPNLSTTFECLAKVGTNGDGSERPMEAMIAGITVLNGAGACNEGFLRQDALLVVTFITDEEDDEESNGNPAGWNAALVAAKKGAEQNIVVLGLIGDPDQPNPVCAMDQAEASPRLRMFAESFTHGTWGSICSPDYAPFFDQAVSVIDTACEQFEPPG
jgi:hypothetical protein